MSSLFQSKKALDSFGMQAKTFEHLNLAEYITMPQLADDHHNAVDALARIMLNKAEKLGPREIMNDVTVLVQIMREEHVKSNLRGEQIEDRLE